MKYLLTILIISALSCKKDNVSNSAISTLPTVTKIETSSEVVNGVAHPKFTITLNVPDTNAVTQLEVYQNARFPILQSGKIVSPKSSQYTIIDMGATYPPSAPVKYFAFFTMKDFSYVSYYTFDVN